MGSDHAEYEGTRWVTWHDLYNGWEYKGIRTASEIHYWGHYPVADLEFVTNAPVSVGLHAWSPFLPGDVAASNTPGALFEVHLRNMTDESQKGSLVFSFPGPSEGEAGTTRFIRREVKRKFHGVVVKSKQANYTLGVIGEEKLRLGGELGMDGEAWATIEHQLPFASSQAGATVAVDFSMAPGQEKVIRRGWFWDWPVVIDGALGPRVGFDYYQNMMLWSIPAAMKGNDLQEPCLPGGLVDRMLRAAEK